MATEGHLLALFGPKGTTDVRCELSVLLGTWEKGAKMGYTYPPSLHFTSPNLSCRVVTLPHQGYPFFDSFMKAT